MDWDLTSFFIEFRNPEMQKFISDLGNRVHSAKEEAGALPALTLDTLPQWEKLLLDYEDVYARRSHLGVYIGCLCAADATHEGFQAEQAAFSKAGAEVSILESQILVGLKDASREAIDALVARPALSDSEFPIRKLWSRAKRRMSLPEESLAAKLGVNGISAWSRMYNSVAGKLEFDMNFPDGKTERLPISQCRSLMTNQDREVRRAAFEGGQAAWSSVSEPLRAAINAISGTRLTLYQQRKVPHFLDIALEDTNTARGTLEAMFQAIDNTTGKTRSILKFKSEQMGLGEIAWYDLEASIPLPDADPVDWSTAVQWVSSAFHRAYPALGEFFDEIIESNWIDWSARPGKRPGGFCATSRFNGESRIFMTHNDCAHDMMTLAHEVGHAWHSRVLRNQRTFLQDYPMTLAESASTFAELILIQGIAANPDISPNIKLQLAAQELNHSATFLLDIPVRFRFESALYEARENGELSISDLNEVMAGAQREVFGETLAKGLENPLFWAEKGHFYIAGLSFYNFPYTYGYLLSRAMLHRLTTEGDSFLSKFESFLLESGSGTCEDVALRTVGVDLTKQEFWETSINSFDTCLERTKSLLAEAR